MKNHTTTAMLAMALLTPLILANAQEFALPARQSTDQQDGLLRAMHEGLQLAYTSMQDFFVSPGKATVPIWKDGNGQLMSQWTVWDFAQGQAEAGFPYETDESVLVDDRAGGSYFWITYLPKYLGGGTFYLTGLRDSDGNLFDGESTYKLNVPADTPASDFWSVIAYGPESKDFYRRWVLGDVEKLHE